MNRRQLLARCVPTLGVVAGCLGDFRSIPPSESALTEDCPRSPDVNGLPERPEELNRDDVTEFLTEYEYTLARAHSAENVGINYVEHVRTEQADNGYRVHFFVEPLPETNTPDSTPPTPTEAARGTYTVAYFIDRRRIFRTKALGPTAHSGLRPREDGTLIAC